VSLSLLFFPPMKASLFLGVLCLWVVRAEGSLWVRGGANGVLSVDLSASAASKGGYLFTSARTGNVLLVGEASRVHCWNQWVNLSVSAVTQGSATDPMLGTYDWATRTFTAAGQGTSPVFAEEFRYYAEHDVFEFVQNFPAGCPGAATLAPPSAGGLGEFNSASSSSASFPSFLADGSTLLSTDLGFVTWQGRFMHDQSTHGLGLNGFAGGSEGGPLALFNATDTQGDALVLSSSDNFMNLILSINPRRDPSSAQCQLIPQTDFEGYDIEPACANVTDSAADCCALCIANAQCRLAPSRF
jgi:hypothetical protein